MSFYKITFFTCTCTCSFILFYFILGYRYFRTSLFFQTFSLVSLLAYLLLSNLLDKSAVLNAMISMVAGVLLGILAMFVTNFGLLIMSFIQSVFLTTCVLYAIHVFREITNVFVAPSIALTSFIALSIPLLKWQRACSVIYICSYGVILMMLAVDFFLDLSMLRKMAYENAVLAERITEPCWFSWTLLSLWPLLLFFGSLVQFLKTARNCDHRHSKC